MNNNTKTDSGKKPPRPKRVNLNEVEGHDNYEYEYMLKRIAEIMKTEGSATK